MAEPYRTPAEPPPRRRIHVPGVLAIHTRNVPALRTPPTPASHVHYLRAGPAAGYQVGSIEDWKGQHHVLRRESLTHDMRRAHDLVLPEEALDAERWPLLHRAALASALIATDEARFAALLAECARGYVVGWGQAFVFGRTLNDVRDISLDEYMPEGERPAIDELYDELGDRLLREASGGELDDAMVSLAVELAAAAEDEWTAQDWQRLLAPVMEPSDEDRESAAAIAQAIDEASEDAEEIELPVYGLARRVRLPALVREVERDRRVARIPPRSIWRVDNVEREPAYGPAPPYPERAHAPTGAPALQSTPPAAPARASVTARVIAAIMLVAGIALLVILIASR